MLFNLSLRYKLPLLGAALIVATAVALSASFLIQAWDGVRQDALGSSEDLGKTMARSLFQALLHDDVWRAFETVSLPFRDNHHSALAESLIVLDVNRQVFASSHPEKYPVLSELAALGSDFSALDKEMRARPQSATLILERQDATHLFIVLPIESDNVRIGTLVVAHSNEWIRERFETLAARALWITLLILAVLLPINWYWGARMVAPLRWVTGRLSHIGSGELAPLDPTLYPYRDEVGDLYLAYGQLVDELKEKVVLKREVIKHERMAAVGRLTASIAHEINNPLGGMLNAISTLKRYGSPDPLNVKTIDLLERGLSQIRDTVAALLVEARITSRQLTVRDVEDVRLLLAPGAAAQHTEVLWQTDLGDRLALPSTPVRQLLINLTLNAIAAAGRGGHVRVLVTSSASALAIVVENDGATLSAAQRERLFEPFSRETEKPDKREKTDHHDGSDGQDHGERGNGLGLWICYQIVTQLAGDIRAESIEQPTATLTRFIVNLPLDPHREPTPTLPD